MTVPTNLETFVREFYRLSDVPDDQYLDLFHDDLEFHIGERHAYSRADLHEMRVLGAKAVANRVHNFDNIYWNDKEPDVVLATGTIDMDRLADGMQIRGLPWMAKIEFRHGKIKKYTAYATFPPLQAK
ncbi:hypothetical protein CcaverHIS002_0212040 [Cutaneotrichosporon cavernicola]|uniref:SnoaL-like domain-containing protein n=1 Tax=Cutaneotrichosporon cavernicola TaxID=279322 RepID=A0AA48L2P3_9TREE|nr:uncharacterized protein CcaverHIS019_0212050 [Cutaneotrichosporon cavernicola]BEI82044.1 hypothetical protein CcaverHIS002_0212040 [Cutaneotrichosporon cavernicola]BEI89843.1 hypothetical protein CcaverHIS019_0212050 [Cutaneotrichosporon cavernicola]BEI97613.1 hypothetical protein CcaverHIS631_0212020 [Cutaneotrichosporon cavernicola]BEJ05392.1 hypothetical protein CcaverHIS641_0212090 [Cutaneotrichosporon cavernicola]